MDKKLQDVRTCLANLQVRAWRLHLSTPGVRATVPMLPTCGSLAAPAGR